MPRETRQSDRRLGMTARQLVKVLIPVGLAVVLFISLVWPGLAFNFTNMFRLSSIWGYKAFNPDIATAGEYVAAVWSEGYNTDSATKQYGRVYLKSADQISGWEGRLEVFNASPDDWGRDPRLVFDPTDPTPSTVHVVWAQANGCPDDCDWSLIKRTTCSLDGTDTCDPPTTVATGLNNASTPDVAVDNSGNVHVIWREGPENQPGAIKYCRNSCGGSPNNTGYTGQHPALAFSGGYLHLVWDTGSNANSTIKYARDGNLGNSAWDGVDLQTWWDDPASSDYHEPSYPAVGANDSAVYVLWAVQRKTDPARYGLAFDFSQNTGETWLTGTSNFGRSIPENETNVFMSNWFAANQAANELYSLQPDVVVTGTGTAGYAHAVWHGRRAEGKYNVWYSYLAGYDDARTWMAPMAVADTPLNKGVPALAVGSALAQTHVALVEDVNASYFGRIDVWYVGANGNRDDDDDAGEGIKLLPILKKNVP